MHLFQQRNCWYEPPENPAQQKTRIFTLNSFPYYVVLCFIGNIPQMSCQGLISELLVSQNGTLWITQLNEQIVK